MPWVRQRAALQRLIGLDTPGAWTLTDEGAHALRNSRPGVAITVYETENGVALWADCETAVSYIHEDVVNLILTSPPYPLTTGREKAYGNHPPQEYVDWLVAQAARWLRTLTADGSPEFFERSGIRFAMCWGGAGAVKPGLAVVDRILVQENPPDR